MVASIKERRTRILLTLYLLDRDKPHSVYEANIKKIFSLPADSPRSRGTVRQMLADNVIVKHEDASYQITEKGLAELALSFPYVRFTIFPWDGLYRIITYEIPEKKRKLRDSLRREISGWGLGPWHRSFWLTPHPVTSALKELVKTNSDYAPYVQAFEGQPVVGELSVLMEKVWNVRAVEASYRQAFKSWHQFLSDQTLSNEEKMQKIVNSYIEVLKTDPGLPGELVGKTWIGSEAWSIFREMRRILLPPRTSGVR
jgi:phenylacetic acid degradation operon negative regulatory protein